MQSRLHNYLNSRCACVIRETIVMLYCFVINATNTIERHVEFIKPSTRIEIIFLMRKETIQFDFIID